MLLNNIIFVTQSKLNKRNVGQPKLNDKIYNTQKQSLKLRLLITKGTKYFVAQALVNDGKLFKTKKTDIGIS